MGGVSFSIALKNYFTSQKAASGYHFSRPASATSVTINNRLDNTLAFSLNRQLNQRLLAQTYYRVLYSYYPTTTARVSDRNDCLQSVGVSLAYFFSNKLSLRAFVNYDLKESSDHFVADYHKLDAVGGLSLNFRFRLPLCWMDGRRGEQWRKGRFLIPFCHLVIMAVRVDSHPQSKP